jgi:hypothetical protein
MMKSFKIPIFLIIIMIMASFPGIYAINTTQQDNNIGEISNGTDGARTIYVAKNGTDRNDGLTPQNPKRNIEVALEAANPGDTIKVGPGIYYTNLQINKNITLIGDKQNNTLIDGQGVNNCVSISRVTVTIANFTLKNGSYNSSKGGGIHNAGTLNLENSTITNCTSVHGGGVGNDGMLILENSTIRNCISRYGSGIDNCGTMTIRGITIKNNRAVKIKNNRAEAWGAGINNDGTLNLENSTIINNTATDAAGGIANCNVMTIRGVTIANNHADQEYGGGIYSYGELTVEDSTIRNNTAPRGAGIDNRGLMYVYGSTIINNMARNGGGIYNANITAARAYIDDLTIITNNYPNDYAGRPFIPA